MKLWPKVRKPSATPNRQKSAYMLMVATVGGLVLFLQWRWLGENRYLFAPFAIERIDCELCGKTGRVPKPGANNELAMCPACYGVGYHTVRRFDESEVLCPACLGLGRLENQDETWRTCRRCDGRGLIRAGAEEEEENPSPLNIESSRQNTEHRLPNTDY